MWDHLLTGSAYNTQQIEQLNAYPGYKQMTSGIKKKLKYWYMRINEREEKE